MVGKNNFLLIYEINAVIFTLFPLSNPSLVVDNVETDSVLGSVDPVMVNEPEHFWVGLKIPKCMVYLVLGYVAGGFVGVYGGTFGVLLGGILGLHIYYFFG